MPRFTLHDYTCHYETHGDPENPPLLCIMGITAPNAIWEDHVEYWQNHFYCITPDNRGVGESDKPDGEYSSLMMAEDTIHLLNHLKIESTHIIGCSMGSTIAQQIALSKPEIVKSLILMCPWARCDHYAISIFKHLQLCKAKLSPAAFMEVIQLLIFNKRSWDNPEFYQTMLDAREEAETTENPQPLHGLIGQASACIHHNTLELLSTITAPTLIIGGEEDIFTPRWMADEIHEKLPNSTLHLYPESGHAFHWENLEDFNQRVTEFVQSH